MLLHVRSGERDCQIEISRQGDGFAAAIDGEPLNIEVLDSDSGELDLRLDGRRWRAFVAARGDERFVFIDGKVHAFRLPDEAAQEEEQNGQTGPNLISQLPGTIVKVLVKPGQSVSEGTGLFIVESMKMETEISAPLAGTVSKIHVAAGQTVGMGDPLLDIEPAAETDA